MQSTPPAAATLWPMPTFSFQALKSFDHTAMDGWHKFMGLNADFTRSMFEEVQFDWASCFVPQDPEDFYVREWSCQIPLLSIPLRYATAMIELTASTQRAWMDAWGHMFGLPVLPTPLSLMPAAVTDMPAAAPSGEVEDVPAASIRETPHPRKGKAASST
ncbi:hypothetical protein ACUXAV_002076 [Cupriavidus metallidurans]|uniref:polyhydroxyalkanoate granule-associated phasin n=1 Tax=Cupriavidus TaxID=106589 RepID=UPI00056A9DD2|nr:polyhydroxyalkanoate granule-associated phasin [Cupriavidus metallidurans]KWW35592.1 hypothetical protein AU374_03659 [Cupriavidus metallidurans]MDE4921731.1 hypothetical protein [Cupriavidus metallidurans]